MAKKAIGLQPLNSPNHEKAVASIFIKKTGISSTLFQDKIGLRRLNPYLV
jgi:hypothetical protein